MPLICCTTTAGLFLTCCATTLSTSMSMRLNSSKQAQAPHCVAGGERGQPQIHLTHHHAHSKYRTLSAKRCFGALR